MQKSIDQIVRGSTLPVAIIIVGVGDADFSTMEVLDGDEEALYSQAFREYMAADIVQFVPFNDFKHNPHLLAKEILEEVPGQLLNFMRKNNIEPYPKSEEQRRNIQAQLSLRPAAANAGNIPQYFLNKKEQFMQQASQMGFDLYTIQDFLENRGICEAQLNVLIDNMQNPTYVNVLKQQIVQQVH